MESLHRQVLPFILRRLKEDVLRDLPPKIIQDYYCDLSPLQVQLYEDFAKSRAMKTVDENVHTAEEEEEDKLIISGTSHIFQVLLYYFTLLPPPRSVLNNYCQFYCHNNRVVSNFHSVHKNKAAVGMYLCVCVCAGFAVSA
jgi:SNF2 family DNA or RNA helicase